MIELQTDLVNWSALQANELLSSLGNRWLHVQGVVELANHIQCILKAADRKYLLAAAYMHDIAYSPSLVVTGFHPLDGANFIRSFGDERLASLVAHHSEARFEADLRGYTEQLNTYSRERSAVTDALIFCDLLTGPMGQRMTLADRRRDVLDRYGSDHVVSRALVQAYPYLSLAIARTTRQLRVVGFS